jgi:hypothetical protein
MKKMNNNLLKFAGAFLMLFSMFSCSVSEPDNPDTENVVKEELLTNASTARVSRSYGIDPTWADAAATGFNNAFLAVDGQGNTYYKVAMNTTQRDQMWTFALDIQAMQDVYERTKSAYYKDIITKLTDGWLAQNPPPYSWDGWNDDIAWMGLTSARSYQITGKQAYLTHARLCFDFVWQRGWDTQYNGGGIWEEQPDMTSSEPIKEALSNNTSGKLAAYIYQSTGDQWYLDRANQIYNWSWHNLYNSSTGQVYRGVRRSGVTDYSTAVYSQGTFVGFADLMHQITGNTTYLNDAIRAIDYTKNNLTVNGILVSNDPNGDTLGDEMARGMGMLCTHNPQLWDVYGNWMVQNATAIWNNRRTDYNLTWNAWNAKTPQNAGEKITHYASAVAWLQYTPSKTESIVSGQTYSIISKSSGKAIDVAAASLTQGANVLQWDNTKAANQRWVVTALTGGSYSIINVNSGMSLDLEGGGAANGANVLQWGWNNGNNQKWTLQPDGNGYYVIVSVASGKAIDIEAGSMANGGNIIQWTINGQDNQKWSFVR